LKQVLSADAKLCSLPLEKSIGLAEFETSLERRPRTCYTHGVYIENLESLTRVLQASISPVALVSGVGLLILSQTNRFTRVTDRLRDLTHERNANPPGSPAVVRQIEIFYRRARLLRLAISSALICVLFATLMILAVFAIAVFDVAVQALVVLLFACSLVSLIVSLATFLWDMHLSLKAAEESLKQ
jgi:hypothetical protein